jgi:threonine dehydrogenase-like Zn-dependent dehydrogenase
VIEEVGSAVKGSAPGDRVMVVPAVGCGICRWCRAGKTNMCEDLHTVGFDYDGTFADYLQIPAQAFAMGNVLLVGDAVRFVRDRTNGRGADVIITACPSGDAHEMAMQAAATRARISLLGGIPGEGQGFLNSNTIHYRELSVFGSHASTVAQNRQALDLLSAGRLDLGKHISATFPLADISAAFEALRGEKVLKVVIRPGGP